MTIKVFFFTAVVVGCSFAGIAQTNNNVPAPTPAGKQPVFNQYDAMGKPQGMWWRNVPEHLGEAAYTEYGYYDHGIKTATWYKISNMGDLVAIENYRNNVLDGEVKYYDHGLLTVIGHYRGLNPKTEYDSVMVVDPETMREILRVVPSDRGTLRHGWWQYYDAETGRLLKEEEYQVDELIRTREHVSKTDSAAYKMREGNLPHNNKHAYKPPLGKAVVPRQY